MMDLFKTAKSGTADQLSALLAKGVNVNQLRAFDNHKTVTPLMLAAKENTAEAVEILLDAGSDVNATDYLGRTALHFAAEFNADPEVTRLLLEYGSEPDPSNLGGATPLMLAAAYNTDDVVSLLLNAGADVNAVYTNGNIPYSFNNELSESRQTDNSLIEAGLLTPEQITYISDMTPLMFAAMENSSVDIIEILIRDGADVNARNNFGATPLFLAVGNLENDVEIIEKLLEAGSDPNEANAVGDTILIEATSSARYQFAPHLYSVVETLLNHGADPNGARPEGYTPLMFTDNIEVADLLISHGANVNATTDRGFSVLSMLLGHKSYFVVKAVLDIPDIAHEELCVYEEATETLIKTLLDAGIDVNVRDKWNRTSLMIAIQERQPPAVCELLLKAKVDPNSTDNKGWTPLMYLASRDNPSEDESHADPEDNAENDANDENNDDNDGNNADENPERKKRQEESLQIAKLLVQYGANPALTNDDGLRAHSLARSNNGLRNFLSRHGTHQ